MIHFSHFQDGWKMPSCCLILSSPMVLSTGQESWSHLLVSSYFCIMASTPVPATWHALGAGQLTGAAECCEQKNHIPKAAGHRPLTVLSEAKHLGSASNWLSKGIYSKNKYFCFFSTFKRKPKLVHMFVLQKNRS